MTKPTQREIRYHLIDILGQNNWHQRLEEIYNYPLEKVFGAIQYTQSSLDAAIKWHGVSALGLFLQYNSSIKQSQLREMMRRIMWNLNEESGGIGWGMAELMAEACASVSFLAEEYSLLFLSYLIENSEGPDNYLEFNELRSGAWWGAQRLAESETTIFEQYKGLLINASQKETLFENRIYAALLIKNLGWEPAEKIHPLERDDDHYIIYHKNEIFQGASFSLIKALGLDS